MGTPHNQEWGPLTMEEAVYKEVRDHVKSTYKDQLLITTEQMIEFFFPEIKNLQVSYTEGDMMLITFDEGIYTKEEVENKLAEFKEESTKRTLKSEK